MYRYIQIRLSIFIFNDLRRRRVSLPTSQRFCLSFLCPGTLELESHAACFGMQAGQLYLVAFLASGFALCAQYTFRPSRTAPATGLAV
jgi:hypothetical protein